MDKKAGWLTDEGPYTVPLVLACPLFSQESKSGSCQENIIEYMPQEDNVCYYAHFTYLFSLKKIKPTSSRITKEMKMTGMIQEREVVFLISAAESNKKFMGEIWV